MTIAANVPDMLTYLDGATGSMLLAAFAGGAAGVGVLFRMYWHRLLGVFSKKHRARAEAARSELVTDEADSEALRTPEHTA